MIHEPPPQNLPEPLPQVGAVLCFDSEISSPDYRGSKNWKLVGSCVLLASDRCLTVGHILGGRTETLEAVLRRYAVFLPYEGFFQLSDLPLDWEERQTKGDNLALVGLAQPVEHCLPLHFLKVGSRGEKPAGRAVVCGYGSWPGSDFGRLEGLQQRHLIQLGPPEQEGVPGWRRYDNLDVSWSSSANNDLTASRGCSGGPLFQQDNDENFVVVGITREDQRDQQAGSWIGRDRTKWLSGKLNGMIPAVSQNTTSLWQLLSLGTEQGKVVPFMVPPGATRVKATLNASQGLRLQMDIVPSDQSGDLLDHLKLVDASSGQFLYRSYELPEGIKEIAIGVCPVANAQARAESVFAQLCVLFV